MKQSIEPNTFAQILEVSPKIILTLIETIGTATLLNPQLALSHKQKLVAAASLLSFGSAVFEQCGCTLDITVNSPLWTHSTRYKTGEDKSWT
jgi:hypothetical protein